MINDEYIGDDLSEFDIPTELGQDPVKEFESLYKQGRPIIYNKYNKKFGIGKNGDGSPFIGVILENHRIDEHHYYINVLYKGFLLKDPLTIPASLKENLIITWVANRWSCIKHNFIASMPRIKRLKRLNIKLMNRQMVNELYNSLDTISKGYEAGLGIEAGQIMKGQIVTTPFYCINDDNQLRVYNFETNELIDPDYEGANFLCYFTFTVTI